MAERSPHRCPVCRMQLFVGRGQNVVLHACGSCRGMWLDQSDARRAIQGYIADKAIALAELVDEGPSAEVRGYRDAATAQGRRCCPQCGKELERRVGQMGAESVEVDACIHGVWFDRGELVRIARTARPALVEIGSRQPRAVHVVALLEAMAVEIEGLAASESESARASAARLEELLAGLRNVIQRG